MGRDGRGQHDVLRDGSAIEAVSTPFGQDVCPIWRRLLQTVEAASLAGRPVEQTALRDAAAPAFGVPYVRVLPTFVSFTGD